MNRQRVGDWYFRTGEFAPPSGSYPVRWKVHNFVTTMIVGGVLILACQAVWP